VFSEVAEIALVSARAILVLNFTRPHAITYKQRREITKFEFQRRTHC